MIITFVDHNPHRTDKLPVNIGGLTELRLIYDRIWNGTDVIARYINGEWHNGAGDGWQLLISDDGKIQVWDTALYSDININV